MKNASECTAAAEYITQTENHFFKSGKVRIEFHHSLENLAMYKSVEIPGAHELFVSILHSTLQLSFFYTRSLSAWQLRVAFLPQQHLLWFMSV